MLRLTGITLVLLLSSLAPAYAQDAKLVKKLEAQNRIASEELDLDDAKSAQLRLTQTLTEAMAGGLEKHALVLHSRVLLAVALADGLGQPDAARAELKTVLAVEPTCELPPAFRKGKTQQLLEQLRTEAAASVPARPRAIEHERVTVAKEGEAIPVAARLAAELKMAKRVTLHYRAVGAADFVEVELVEQDTMLRGEIPAAATATNALEYYIAAWNAKGKLIASEANPKAPVALAVVRTVKATVGGATEDEEREEENPLAKEKTKGKKKVKAKGKKKEKKQATP